MFCIHSYSKPKIPVDYNLKKLSPQNYFFITDVKWNTDQKKYLIEWKFLGLTFKCF